MFDFSRLGTGPRPDLVQQELEERAKRSQAEAAEEEKRKNDPVYAAKCDAGKPDRKDALAMVIAMVELTFPWIAGGIAIYFLAVFLFTRI